MILIFIICSAFRYRSVQECIWKDSFLDLIPFIYLFCLRIQIGGSGNSLKDNCVLTLKSDSPRLRAGTSLK